ncbi:sensor histidine kinase [Chondromyces apiculatus]|uniref:histidine kinase n=1 Tax=Chondromyces apiculatus DSM 436 TaxID=1192034 RepID=A0A017TEM0_9BACT|nr:HAMP domain-containing sensor histidine kinase [Chondromyces apiculatus]EYF07684.1 Hypothetical protein CAP_8185 [Chondromyces apiculatus DSM 436]
MRLRLRLALTTLAVTAPTIVALVALDARMRHAAAEQALARIAFQHMLESGARDRCEATPATWGGTPLPAPRTGSAPPHDLPLFDHPSGPASPPPPPADGERPVRAGEPPVLFAYDALLRAANPRAPVLDEDLVEAIATRDVAAEPFTIRGPTVQVLLRMPWTTGPCTYVLARGTTGPGWLGAILPASRVWLVPVGIVIVAVLLAVGPVVGRIRKLTEAVRRSAAQGFTGSVTSPGDDEIAELGRAFDAASQEVRTQLAEKDRREQALRDYLANTTHDVMIPLTVLQAHLSTLQERAARNDPFDMSVLVSAMDEAHYLASLMHNLAIATKLDAGEPQLHRAPVDLNALVNRVMGRHRPIARQRDIALESAVPEHPVVTDADVTLLEQAVSNIVYNAIRHNRPGGHVAVLLEVIHEGRFRVRVLDDGPGIPEADLSRLVERGFRGDEARTRAPDGQGLGLHITFRVAALHDLDLRFQPSEYGGLQVDLEGYCGP